MNRDTSEAAASEQGLAPADYVREVTIRYVGPRRKSTTIRGPEDAACFMRALLRDDAREHFLALFLNGAHQVISYSLVSLGCATASPVHPREIFQPAIVAGACAVIVGHNHPSADLTPSTDDLAVTRRLKDGGTLLGVPVLDHVIFSRAAHVSLRDLGHMPLSP